MLCYATRFQFHLQHKVDGQIFQRGAVGGCRGRSGVIGAVDEGVANAASVQRLAETARHHQIADESDERLDDTALQPSARAADGRLQSTRHVRLGRTNGP